MPGSAGLTARRIAMANDTPFTIIGNLTADPELRFTSGGHAVANFTVASTPRRFDKNSNEWKDQDALFMRCSVWREMAEQVAESLTRGMRVWATGNIVQRSYETREGEKRTVYELEVQDVGPSLKWATARVTRVTKGSTQAGPAGDDVPPRDDPWGSAPANSSTTRSSKPSDDPWGSSTPGPSTQGGFTDEPPF